ncbi:cyclic GMP-AMP synthase-like receptor [Achroia grisella]|uniref:cyclic GMP-AMP synthase-like receptor n=1 Tax=Achroia grisella TaxID=688607 RepID=UPI0027D263EA|nr:cyclic GMP-AMP synthase-like receptor [Achroia grisella]XP_059061427.1 cyclic GMP-AMP synthase-like receptor [Achroia grisella]
MNNNGDRNRNREREDDGLWWKIPLGIGAAAAVIGGIVAAVVSSSNDSAPDTGQSMQYRRRSRRPSTPDSSPDRSSNISYNFGALEISDERIIPQGIRSGPVINNLDSLLADIYMRFISLKDDALYYRVFHSISSTIRRNMEEVDPYFKRYSSTAQIAGSHYDNLRIRLPDPEDEFDMDIVIDLPLNMRKDRLNPSNSDIVLEPSSNGYIQLKMGTQYQNLPNRDEWHVNKTAYGWRDDEFFLSRAKFSDWFKSITYKALNKLEKYYNYRSIEVAGTKYIIRTSESGPAITLKISDPVTDFKMSIDIVPALRFPEERWPVRSDYRDIPPGCSVGDYGWMVVPKPASSGESSRSWRLALHNQERKLFYGTYNLRQTVRYLKKLRDAEGMNEIASYYIKTLFFWEVIQQKSDERFWNQPLSKLFIIMVKKFQQALANRNIPYFWNKNHNLIDGVAPNVVAGYANKLKKLVVILDDPTRYKEVAKYLLTIDEYNSYDI